MRIYILALFIVQLSTLDCFGQAQAKFDKIDLSKGLSSNRISSIVKENNGYAWIGTDNGLNRYDGSQLKIFNKNNSGLSSNNITDLLIDRKGRLWIATLDAGLNLYNPQSDVFTVYLHSLKDKKTLPSNHIQTLIEDKVGNLWIGTDLGLSLFVESSQTFINYSGNSGRGNALGRNVVTSIYEDSSGIIWVGTFGDGLNKFQPKTKQLESIKAPKGIYSNFINAVHEFDNETLVIGTQDSGLLKFDKKTSSFTTFFDNKLAYRGMPTIVRSIYKDGENNLWIGTDGNGLLKVKNKARNLNDITNYLHNGQFNASLSGNAIYDIIEDSDHNIWIGTAWSGVNILNPKSNYEFLFSDIKGENLVPVLSIHKNKDYLYLGLDGEGLVIYNLKSKIVKRYSSKLVKSFRGDYVQCIYEAKNGVIFIGTFANGLIKYEPKTGVFTQYKSVYKNNNSLSFNDVRSIEEDENSNLWVATWGGGLNYLNVKTGNFIRFLENDRIPGSISSNNIVSMKRDGDFLWLATFGGGLCKFNTVTKKSINFKHNIADLNSISSNYLFSLLVGDDKNVWIGTSGGGVIFFNTQSNIFNNFKENKEISNLTVTGILSDYKQNIWFSSKQGIYEYNKRTGKFIFYNTIAGEYGINSVFKDDKELLYFGTTTGVLRFDPHNFSSKSDAPVVKLTDFKLYNKEITVGKNRILTKTVDHQNSIVLDFDLKVITFEFAALLFPTASSCEYAIKMDGFDAYWREIGKERSVTYTNLAPGDYTFKVKSKTRGSEWGEKYTSIDVKILKPFWLSWWAILGYLLLIVLIFYFFRKYIVAWEKMKNNLELERRSYENNMEISNLKQQFFTNVSHDIRTPVTLILGAINRMIRNNEVSESSQNGSLIIVKKNCNHLIHLVNQLLDYDKFTSRKLNVTCSDFVKFCEEVYLSFTEIASQKNIDFSFHSSDNLIELWFDKNEMEKVLYNLLINAFKFSESGGSIKIVISVTDSTVKLECIDKGVGISNNDVLKIFNRFYKKSYTKDSLFQSSGLGLSIAKEIIELHDGTISVESKKDYGTNFTIHLNKGKAHFKQEDIALQYVSGEDIENYFVDKFEETDNYQLHVQNDNSDNSNRTVLIVEDNIEIRNYIVSLLQPDFETMVAANGKEALILATSKLPDIIISDVMMPFMDGITLTRQLKSHVNTSHIPVILLTARTSIMNKIEGFDIGADDYILKPFNESLLISRIKSVLKNRKIIHEKFTAKDIISLSELSLNKSDEAFMKKFVAIIDSNISSTDLSAQFVCSAIGMSHSVMYKKLKGLTNMTYVEFVRDYKLKIAKKLISDHNFSVLDAAYHVGYSDRKYFSKQFKSHFGQVPSYYISKLR